MKRILIPVVVLVLIVGAFGAGYLARSMVRRASRRAAVTQDQQPQNQPAQDQQPSQDQQQSSSDQQSKPQGRTKDRADGGKSMVTAVIDRVETGRLIVTVQDARGGGLQQGSSLTVEAGQGVEVLREIPFSELKKGDIVILRGSTDGGRFFVQGIRVEVRK